MAQEKSFNFLCSCLSPQVAGLANSSRLKQIINKERVNWQEVISIADKHYVLPLLHFMLIKKELSNILPEELQKTLTTIYELNQQRNERLKQQILEIVRELNVIEVSPVLLKGATALFSKLYPNPACRMMGDLDLLVPADRLKECIHVLESDGYCSMGKPDEFKGHHHWVPLSRSDRIAAVELHREIAAEPAAKILDAKMIQNEAALIDCNGVQLKLCSDSHFAMHNILHHQLSGTDLYERRIFSLYQVYDLVQLMQLPEGTIAWKNVLSRFKQHGYGREVTLYFVLIKELFHQPFPAGIPKLSTWRRDWLLTKGQINFPFFRYYYRIFFHLVKHREQRSVFIRQLFTPKSYLNHYRRLSVYLYKKK